MFLIRNTKHHTQSCILWPVSPNRVVKNEQTTLHSKGTNCLKHMVLQKHHVTHTSGVWRGAGQQTVPDMHYSYLIKLILKALIALKFNSLEAFTDTFKNLFVNHEFHSQAAPTLSWLSHAG